LTAKISFWRDPVVLAIGLSSAALLTYYNSFSGPFIFDDEPSILSNPTIHSLWRSWWPPSGDGITVAGRPLLNFTLAVNYAMSGPAVWSYHLTNLTIHVLAALTLMGIVRRTLERMPFAATNDVPVASLSPRPPARRSGSAIREAAPLMAFFSALLWMLHPLQTEAVTYIIQRAESLCGLFYFLTLYTFIRGIETRVPPNRAIERSRTARGWFALSILFCLAGMATKEVMATAPIIVLLYDRTFGSGGFSAAWHRHRNYYLALAGTWLVLFAFVLASSGRGGTAGFGTQVTPLAYALTQIAAVSHYLRLAFWPTPLVFDYGQTLADSWREIIWPSLLLLPLAGASLWGAWRGRPAGFCGFFFFAVLAPSSSVVPVVTQTIAEHRMYLALAAVIVPAVVGLHHLLGRKSIFLFLVFAVGLGATTERRNRDYRNSLSIWSDTARKRPQNPRAQNNLALALKEQGRNVEANEHFVRAINLNPNYVSAHSNWGVALMDQGRLADAIVQLETAVQLAPAHADAQVNLGNALVRMNHLDEAIPHYEAALAVKPAADAYYDLGFALAGTGQADEAAKSFLAALQLQSDLPEAHYQLARLAEQANDLSEAERHYAATLRLAPNHAAAHAHFGLLLARSGRLDAAAAQLQAAIGLKPDDANAHANLGNVWLLQGRMRDAIGQYEEVLRLRPNDAAALENLQLARDALKNRR
jgi:tetratricopeptide (TPR) repeat protein